ncbi:MAG: hypothetical protein WEB52_09470 [Dehalococcoidia bacterium]
MTEVNEPRAGYEKDLYDLEMELYLEALEKCVGEWIAIFDGKLIHSPNPDEIRAQLPPGAFTSGKAIVTFVGSPPPYRIRI